MMTGNTNQPTVVGAPMSGTVRSLSSVPDAIFAQEMLGPGVALWPRSDQKITVVSPVAGTIGALHQHALVIVIDDAHSLLLHLGIDTFRAGNQVFVPHVKQDQVVQAGQELLDWNIALSTAQGMEPWVTITVLASSLDYPVKIQNLVGDNGEVAANQALLEIL